jgi:hypothetical protein
MNKQDIIKYEVIDASKDNKKKFNKLLKDNDIHIIGTFENEQGELFILFSFFKFSMISITGDELGWETHWIYDNGRVFIPFVLTSSEVKKAEQILKGDI